MKKVLKRAISSVLAAALVISTMAFAGFTSVAAADNYISQQGGWFESAYVEWNSVPNATGFAAYVKEAGASDSAYTQLDNELIRKYSTYFRADAVGLKAGSYVIKVVPYINDVLDESQAFVSDTLTVDAYDRSGAAFSKYSDYYNQGVGAYNNDGTLKSDAKVFYVTADTAKTITTDLITSNKGATTTYTGFQDIIYGKQKGYDTTPLDFRIIGTIELSDMDSILSSEEGLQVKGNSGYSEMNITIEGIGEDAAIKDFGILARNCGNVEFRNFAIYNCMDDCLSLDTQNCNIWVHNMDFFYGSAGSDSDQAKGDGTVDIKAKSQFVTVSYNHFFDSGKSSLCGMSSEVSTSHITYHHNWFDHSDSRHPRIRTMSVHVYNNYFDGNAKYGVGSAVGSSAFVQNNYFENCKYPVITGSQGADMISGNSVLSGEKGGIIKMFGNYITGATSYTTYQADPSNFDAYEATSEDEVIPSSVVTANGYTYNNFDTNTSSYDLAVNKLDAAEDVPAVVTASAGRMNGGDFFETTGLSKDSLTAFTSASDYNVDTTLKNAIVNYTSALVSVGGTTTGGTVNTTESTEATTETSTETTTTTVTTTTTTVETSTETTTDVTPDPTPAPTAAYGDADGDGDVDANDVALVIQHILNGTALNNTTEYVDVNKDGKIDSQDAAMILQY